MGSQRRVVIVDFNHLGYKYAYGMGGTALYFPLAQPDGSVRKIVTNIQNGAGKAIHRWTRGGYDIPIVTFDRPCPARTAWFNDLYPKPEGTATGRGQGQGYKGNRSSASRDLLEAIEMTQSMLANAGVTTVFSGNGGGYEADDLIKAAVDKAKESYPGMPIDIVTGDADMLPFVDEDVSVFLVSKRGTYATEKSIEKTKYWQVTPENFSEYVSSLSAFKSYAKYGPVPYNTVLLIKALRGDSSDNIPAVASRSMTPKRVMSIISDLQEADVPVDRMFRYGENIDNITLRLLPLVIQNDGLFQEISTWLMEELSSGETHPTAKLFDGYHNLSEFFMENWGAQAKGIGKDEFSGMLDLSQVRKNFSIMDLNTRLGGHRDKVAKLSDLKSFDEIKYAGEFSRLNINIPVGRY